MIKLNMLPDVKREYIRARQTEAKVIAGAVLGTGVAAGIVILLALWVYGAQTLQKNLLTDSIKDNMQELYQVKDIDKYVTIQNQLSHIDTLHSKKMIYSRVFDVLSTLNPQAPNNVRISKLNVDSATSIMTFEGETASFTALETFRDTLKNADLVYSLDDDTTPKREKLFSVVTVDSNALGKDEKNKQIVSFKISTTFATNTFSEAAKNISVSVPNKETTQSKVDAPDVFAGSTIKTEGGQ